MIQWWTSLDATMKILWAITLSASLIFVIQTVMTFLGAADIGGDFDINTDTDFSGDIPDVDGGAVDAGGTDIDGTSGHSGIGLLSFRNLVNFCLGFGWTAVLLRGEISSSAVLFILATIVGVGLVAGVMLLFKWISGMQQSGNIDVFKSAVDCVGKVYLAIPAERAGQGKVQITINNSVREYDAVTDGAALPTGSDIKVVEVLNASTLLVEEINTLII